MRSAIWRQRQNERERELTDEGNRSSCERSFAGRTKIIENEEVEGRGNGGRWMVGWWTGGRIGGLDAGGMHWRALGWVLKRAGGEGTYKGV